MSPSPTILLVEDDAAIRRTIAKGLSELAFRVQAAGTAAEARHILASEEIDLMMLDLGLPDGDGLDLLRDVRSGGSNLPVIILTARDGVGDTVTSLENGADDYVTKPVQLPDLLVKLRKGLERRALERQVQALRRGAPDVASILRRSRSPRMQRVIEMAERVAESPDTPVLVQGESGSGKDLVARFIHERT